MNDALNSVPLPIVAAAMGLALVMGILMGLCLRRPKRPVKWENGSSLRHDHSGTNLIRFGLPMKGKAVKLGD